MLYRLWDDGWYAAAPRTEIDWLNDGELSDG